MFELYQLRYFIAIVETGTFTKAAERACVTQPTLSAGIKKLEEHIGTRLFYRTSRRVFLTEAGTAFLQRAKAILFECNRAVRELSHTEAPKVLRLGIVRTIPIVLVSKLIEDFRAQDDRAAIELFEGTEQEVANRLENGGADLAITLLRDDMGPANVIPLFEEGYALALSDGHRLARRKSITAAELANDNMVVRTRCEVLSETSRYFTDRNVRPRLVYRTNNDERALEMIRVGLGVTVMPESYRWDGVARVPLEGFGFRRSIALVAPPRAPAKENRNLVETCSVVTSSQAWGSAA